MIANYAICRLVGVEWVGYGAQRKRLEGRKQERGSQDGARHSKERLCYDLNHLGVFNSLSWGITAMMSFSSILSFPFLIITTVALALLVGTGKSLLGADRRSMFLRTSFISISVDVGDVSVAVAT